MALTYLLKEILDTKVVPLQEANLFLKPVSKKLMKSYYEVIKEPMFLETMQEKVKKNEVRKEETNKRNGIGSIASARSSADLSLSTELRLGSLRN